MSENPIRSDRIAGIPPAEPGLRARLRELRAALLYLTGSDRGRLDAADVARGGAFFPALGFVLGALVAALLLLAPASWPSPALGATGVVLLWIVSRGTLPRALGRLARAAASARGDRAAALGALDSPALGTVGVLVVTSVLVAKGMALSALDGSTLAFTLVLAATLGRWAIVVQGYGSLAARPDDSAAVFAREVKFGQFGVASVSAMAATLVLGNAIGIVLLLTVATVTVGTRILVHRWLGGVAPVTLDAAGEIAESTAVLVCAGLVLLARAIEG